MKNAVYVLAWLSCACPVAAQISVSPSETRSIRKAPPAYS